MSKLSKTKSDLEEDLKDWTEFVTQSIDLFVREYCGYWLRGVEWSPQGWLAWEDDERYKFGNEPQLEEALAAWRKNESLPPHWFRLDKELAQKAWALGQEKWGRDWYEQADSTEYDVVIQLALLGEVVYS